MRKNDWKNKKNKFIFQFNLFFSTKSVWQLQHFPSIIILPHTKYFYNLDRQNAYKCINIDLFYLHVPKLYV